MPLIGKNQVLLNRERMEHFAPMLCAVYDGLFELNLTRKLCRTLFYTKGKPQVFDKEYVISPFFPKIFAQMVCPEDRDAFVSFLRPERLEALFCGACGTQILEFRYLTGMGTTAWTQATLVPVRDEEESIILCSLLDIDIKKQMELENQALQVENDDMSERLFDIFGSIYNTIITVSLPTDQAVIIKAEARADLQGRQCSWNQLWHSYCHDRISEADRKLVQQEFSAKNLSRLVLSGRSSKSIEARCLMEDSTYAWTEISAHVLAKHTTAKLVLTTRNVNEQKLLSSIVERFVYQNCDYFIYIDAGRDSYVMFSGNDNGTPLPPNSGESYTQELLRYNRSYVVPEDYAMCCHEMQISRILEVLETKAEHSFFVGVMDPKRGYTRKHVQYIYFDKAAGTILMTRTDVTQVYMEEKKKEALLRAAWQEAKTDPLTGLYNKKAMRQLVARRLKDANGHMAALLFLDLDNFKSVNDTLGHMQGDAFLQKVAEQFRANMRPTDVVGRVGGDEFLIFLPEIRREENIRQCALRLCRVFSSGIKKDAVAATCSIGISVYPRDGKDYAVLVEKADKALYHAKRSGKNRFSFFGVKPPGAAAN